MQDLPMPSELSELLPFLTQQERVEMDRLLTAPKKWAPTPGPQLEAFNSPATELLYGGAAGGGKSDLLLGLARYAHKSSVLLRRTFPQLSQSLIKRSREIYGDHRALGGYRWWWPAEQREIRFGHLDKDTTVLDYHSAAFDLIAPDELTQLSLYQYEYMFSRARSTIAGQRVRIVSATNPGGPGHRWVKARWAPWLDKRYHKPAQPGELRWFKRDQNGADVECLKDDPDGISRTFILAKLKDNPYLGEEYRKMLKSLPEPYRSQLLEGDWDASEGEDATLVISPNWVLQSFERWKARQNEAQGPLTCVGVDVAHGGMDQTVLALRFGSWVAPLRRHRGVETPDGMSVVRILQPLMLGGGQCNIDAIGYGASATEQAQQKGMKVNAINFGEGTTELDRTGNYKFANIRALAYWRLREALDPDAPREDGEQALALPPDDELLSEITAARWDLTFSGAIKLEAKDDIKKRIGRSPDAADAVALACLAPSRTFDPVLYAKILRGAGKPRQPQENDE